LLWDFFTRVMQGVTTSFLEDIWSRSFINLFASPLTITEYVTGLVLTSIATSLIGLIVMLILATSIFHLSYFSFGLLLIPFLLVLFLFGIALGIAGTALVLRLGPASEWPQWMHAIAYLLPPSYVFEGMRAILLGQPFSSSLLVWGITLACSYILLAGWYFTRVYRYAVQTGLLARYSAESAS